MTRIFLSADADEFEGLSVRLGAVCFKAGLPPLRHQDDLKRRGEQLSLGRLAEEIQTADLVVHVLGKKPSAGPSKEHKRDLLRRFPDFRRRFPAVVAAARKPPPGYIQGDAYLHWEAWLALYVASQPGSSLRFVCFDVADTRADRAVPEIDHARRLRAHRVRPRKIPAGSDVASHIISTLIELGYFTQADSERLVHLPWPSLGPLFHGRDAAVAQVRQSLHRAGVPVGVQALACPGDAPPAGVQASACPPVGVQASACQPEGSAPAVEQRAVEVQPSASPPATHPAVRSPVTAICGPAGIGKTRLAVEFAWQQRR